MIHLSSEAEKYVYYRESNPDLIVMNGDCLEILPLLPKVDLVVTDPPYGIIGGGKSIGGGNFVDVNKYDCEWDKNRFTKDQSSGGGIQFGSMLLTRKI